MHPESADELAVVPADKLLPGDALFLFDGTAGGSEEAFRQQLRLAIAEPGARCWRVRSVREHPDDSGVLMVLVETDDTLPEHRFVSRGTLAAVSPGG